MNDAESKFRSLQEDKLWVANDPTEDNMMVLTTVIGNLTRQLDSKGTTKQSNIFFGNSNPSTAASSNNENYVAPKPGESFTKMFRKQLKTYCSKYNKGKGFWGWQEDNNHDDNCV